MRKESVDLGSDMPSPPLQAPFPYFGGKRTVSPLVWERFGVVNNYVEPFAGSLALLLTAPLITKVETVNDLDGLIANFWRSVHFDPDAVAEWADYPVSEVDLHPRHAYLVSVREELSDGLMGDPEFFDAKAAGWWAWGACSWIGTGYCSGKGPWHLKDGRLVKASPSGSGINRQLPHLGDSGRGILAPQGLAVRDWLRLLRDRLRSVRITCGDWRRVVTPVVTTRHGLTAVPLDPPYKSSGMEYATGGAPAEDVEKWCRENGGAELLRIALFGLEGDYDLPGWDQVPWTTRGGYGNQGASEARSREVVWFSPNCLRPRLFPEIHGAQSGIFDPPP